MIYRGIETGKCMIRTKIYKQMKGQDYLNTFAYLQTYFLKNLSSGKLSTKDICKEYERLR